MENPNFLTDGLREELAARSYFVTQQLAELYPHRAIVEGNDCSFDLKEFADAFHCGVTAKDEKILNQIKTGYISADEGISHHYATLYFEALWQGNTLDIVLMTWPTEFQNENHYWIVADEAEIAEGFFKAVCDWASEVRGEVLVYEGGGWEKSKDLFEAIQSARFENLILAGTLKEEIRDDLMRFFASREQYEQYGVPWKRGVLLIGPPGNGKTHCVKALINHIGQPCLYVKSFKSQYATDQDNIRNVFSRARKTTPCMLVMEDLDSLIDDSNRAFFLNELDGFAANVGIITLATTNHPERLDPSIVDRPSRFDRKYHFELPGETERRDYIALWNGGLQPDLRLTDAGIEALVTLTEEFSFAYLKELFVSSVMRWINAPQPPGGMDTVAQAQVALLREQMSSMTADYADENTGEPDPMAEAKRARAMMMRRFQRR